VGEWGLPRAGSSRATEASVLHSSSQSALVVGLGADVPLSWRLSVGVEAVYHHQNNEVYSSDTTTGIDGGDLTTFDLLMRLRL